MPNSDGDRRPDETEPLLGALLRMPYHELVSDGIEPALAASGFSDIRTSYFPVLQALTANPGGLRSTELAVYARITKQSMGFLVDHLVASGYIERIPDPVDRRAKVIRLTSRGWDAAKIVRDSVRRVEHDWEQRIGPERVAQLREILRDLVASRG